MQNEFLWTFEELDKNIGAPLGAGLKTLPSVGPAPMLKPEVTNDSAFQMFQKGYDRGSYTIDVIKDFPWTQSPQNIESISEVPVLHLRENTIEYNPLVNQLIHSVGALGGDVSGIANRVGSLLNDLRAANDEHRGEGFSVIKSGKGTGKGIVKNIEDGIDKKRSLKKILGNTLQQAGPGKDFDVMNPYKDLYTTRHTGWKYKLPWFYGSFRNIDNSFGGDRGPSMLQSVANFATNLARGVGNAINTIEPGSYLDIPKPFAFNTEGKSYTIGFPLLNTTTYEQLIRNWQFVFLLAYHNMPNRITRSLIMPPVIYEALVPSTWYAPYAYISHLDIGYIGSARKMNIRIPSVSKNILDDFDFGFSNIDVVIPDAYLITIGFTELVPEAQNHMYSAISRRNLNSNVRTGEVGQGGMLVDTAKNVFGEIKDKASAFGAKFGG